LERKRNKEKEGEGEGEESSPLPTFEGFRAPNNNSTYYERKVITMETRVTVNALEIVKNKCKKETQLPLSFEIVKGTGTSYKVLITCGSSTHPNSGPRYLFSGKRFTTREAKAMFDMLRMMRQLNWVKPAGTSGPPILWAEYGNENGKEAWCLNELNIPG
jgi:hypothetical protein